MTEFSTNSFSPSLPRNVLDTLFETEMRIRRANDNHLGYPFNLQPFPAVPHTLTSYLINNMDDPFAGSSFGSEVNELEREVIKWLSVVWGGPDLDIHRGSVRASGTDSNQWAVYLGREFLPDAVLLHSADAHCSVPEAARLMRVETREVASTPAGEIELVDMARVLESLKGRPVILALTCGTSLKGGHDDIVGALQVLDDAGITPDQRFVHVDGALNAMVLPFLPAAPKHIRPDFTLGVDSISTSGHKMIGTPMPCGVLVARKTHLDRVARHRADDTTQMGSRNGHATLAIWVRLMTQGLAGFSRSALRCTMRAADLASSLRAIGADVLLNPYSMTIVFPRPSEEIVQTYQLACHQGKARAIIMPSVSDALIERFMTEYSSWFSKAGRPD